MLYGFSGPCLEEVKLGGSGFLGRWMRLSPGLCLLFSIFLTAGTHMLGKPGFSDGNMQCHMLCVQSEGNGPFPFILMQGGMDQNSGGKDQVAI